MTTPPKRRPRIAIVGAGFAGLRCADILLQHDFPVTIFEARCRLGGRIAQSSPEALEGHTVDLGPNWIHGHGHGQDWTEDPMLRIARQTGTEVFCWEAEDGGGEAVVDEDGVLLAQEDSEELGELVWGADGLIQRAFKLSEEGRGKREDEGGVGVERSLYDFFEEHVESLFAQLPPDEARSKRERLLQFTRVWGAYVGCDVRRQSLRFFWLEKTIEGENTFVAGTYSRILEEVARPAREGADVRLNTKVERIETGKGVAEGRRQVKISTADGKTEEFDEVVVTVPLGCLKRDASAIFGPPLPDRLMAAITNLGYGNLDKVYITFPEAFWNLVVSPSDQTSPSPDSEGKTASFTSFLPPTYASDTNPCHWDQTVLNLASLPASTAQPTLLFYVYGDCATHIASLLPSPHDPCKPLDRVAQTAISEFFQPYISLLPNHCSTNPACTPMSVLATGWSNDEFAGYGSYSNFQVGLEAGDEDILRLREGCPERGLWFAGEHSAPFDALGTTTGAYLAGEEVGRKILGKYSSTL